MIQICLPKRAALGTFVTKEIGFPGQSVDLFACMHWTLVCIFMSALNQNVCHIWYGRTNQRLKFYSPRCNWANREDVSLTKSGLARISAHRNPSRKIEVKVVGNLYFLLTNKWFNKKVMRERKFVHNLQNSQVLLIFMTVRICDFEMKSIAKIKLHVFEKGFTNFDLLIVPLVLGVVLPPWT